MKHKQGFTLTEILLAVMIVGVIGVALASLTTAASRESEVGRSRALLRNDLTIALQQIKEDINNYNTVLYAAGGGHSFCEQGSAPNASCRNYYEPLLLLAKNTDLNGNAFTTPDATAYPVPTPEYVVYCFKGGGTKKLSDGSTPVQPQYRAFDGGTIVRRVFTGGIPWAATSPYGPDKSICSNADEVLLDNVKFIHWAHNNPRYPVPLFAVEGWGDSSNATPYSVKNPATATARAANVGGQLKINLILELPSFPVVNQAVEVVFSPGNGYADSRVNN